MLMKNLGRIIILSVPVSAVLTASEFETDIVLTSPDSRLTRAAELKMKWLGAVWMQYLNILFSNHSKIAIPLLVATCRYQPICSFFAIYSLIFHLSYIKSAYLNISNKYVLQ